MRFHYLLQFYYYCSGVEFKLKIYLKTKKLLKHTAAVVIYGRSLRALLRSLDNSMTTKIPGRNAEILGVPLKAIFQKYGYNTFLSECLSVISNALKINTMW